MAGSTSRGTWKTFERDVAAALTAALGVVMKRNILSGANNRKDNGDPRPGDVAIPEGYDMLAECKYAALHRQHTLFDGAQADAAKHKINPMNVFLFTKVKRSQGWLVTMRGEMFNRIIAVPAVHDMLKNDTTER